MSYHGSCIVFVRSPVLTVMIMRMTVVCSVVEIYWHFRGTYSLHHQTDGGDSLLNIPEDRHFFFVFFISLYMPCFVPPFQVLAGFISLFFHSHDILSFISASLPFPSYLAKRFANASLKSDVVFPVSTIIFTWVISATRLDDIYQETCRYSTCCACSLRCSVQAQPRISVTCTDNVRVVSVL